MNEQPCLVTLGVPEHAPVEKKTVKERRQATNQKTHSKSQKKSENTQKDISLKNMPVTSTEILCSASLALQSRTLWQASRMPRTMP